jgi:hypothetical protein
MTIAVIKEFVNLKLVIVFVFLGGVDLLVINGLISL